MNHETRFGSSADNEPPRSCPSCGQDLSHPYDQSAPSATARMLRKVALALLPAMAAGYIALLFWGSRGLGFGTGHGYMAVLFIGGPSLLLYACSRLLPEVRRVICQRCSWNHEYPGSAAAKRVA